MILRCYNYMGVDDSVPLRDAIPQYIGEIQRSMTQNISYIILYGRAFLNSVILSLPLFQVNIMSGDIHQPTNNLYILCCGPRYILKNYHYGACTLYVVELTGLYILYVRHHSLYPRIGGKNHFFLISKIKLVASHTLLINYLHEC